MNGIHQICKPSDQGQGQFLDIGAKLQVIAFTSTMPLDAMLRKTVRVSCFRPHVLHVKTAAKGGKLTNGGAALQPQHLAKVAVRLGNLVRLKCSDSVVYMTEWTGASDPHEFPRNVCRRSFDF